MTAIFALALAMQAASSPPPVFVMKTQGFDTPTVEKCERKEGETGKRAEPCNTYLWTRRIIENYPSEAQCAGMEGRVGVLLIVGTDGLVKECEITRTSGFPVLDAAACRGLLNFAQFYPAVDESGAVVEGRYSTTITYSLN